MNVNVVDQTHNSCLLSVCILLDTLPSGKIFRNVLATYITLLCVTGSIKRYFKRTSIITKKHIYLIIISKFDHTHAICRALVVYAHQHYLLR